MKKNKIRNKKLNRKDKKNIGAIALCIERDKKTFFKECNSLLQVMSKEHLLNHLRTNQLRMFLLYKFDLLGGFDTELKDTTDFLRIINYIEEHDENMKGLMKKLLNQLKYIKIS